jgi:hypothetical protein
LNKEESIQFQALAKDAGNKLRAYILGIASGGTAVIFATLTGDNQPTVDIEKWCLLVALIGFILTAVLSLLELRVDAKRAFHIAKQHEKDESEQDWSPNEYYRTMRLWLINASYLTLAIAITALATYTISRIF